jgi:hypothetical protein
MKDGEKTYQRTMEKDNVEDCAPRNEIEQQALEGVDGMCELEAGICRSLLSANVKMRKHESLPSGLPIARRGSFRTTWRRDSPAAGCQIQHQLHGIAEYLPSMTKGSVPA